MMNFERLAKIEERERAASGDDYSVSWLKGHHAILEKNVWDEIGDPDEDAIARFDSSSGYRDLDFCAKARIDIRDMAAELRRMYALLARECIRCVASNSPEHCPAVDDGRCALGARLRKWGKE